MVLWFGEGGWLATIAKQNNFLELEKAVREDEEILLKLRAEARDLQEGHRSIEERARFQHGMLEKGKYLFSCALVLKFYPIPQVLLKKLFHNNSTLPLI